MALVWSWGWEINAPTQSYLDTGWISSNSAFVDTQYLDSAQPLSATGGGERCLKIMQWDTTFQTPYTLGQPALFEIQGEGIGGWITFYVKFEGDFWNDNGGDFFKFGGCFLTTDQGEGTTGKTITAQLGIKDNNGLLTQLDPVATLTQNVWHRISIKISGSDEVGENGAITEIYYNGQLCSSGAFENFDVPGGAGYSVGHWDPNTGGPSISALEFGSPCHSITSVAVTLYDHVFVYNDEADDGNRELYIHGLKPRSGTVGIHAASYGWTDEVGGTATGEPLYAVGDGNYLQTTDASNNLHVTYETAGTAFFDEIIAINQISFNQGSGNLNNISTYAIIDFQGETQGDVLAQISGDVPLTSTGKLINVFELASVIDTGPDPSRTISCANGVDGKHFKGAFNIDNGN